LNPSDRNLFLNRCSLHAARQRRKRLVVTALAGALFSMGALSTLQAASESGGQLSIRQPFQGAGSRLLSGVGAAGYAADALPYALLASVPKAGAGPIRSAEAVDKVVDVEAAATPTPPGTPVDSATAALAVIEQWARAWQGRDVAGYLAAYGEGFQPARGLSRDDWARLRRQRIADKRVIQLELRDIEARTEAADRVRISFVQDYRADQFVERGTAKSMLLVREKDGWRIVAEESAR